MKYINIDTEGFYDMKDFDGEEWKDLAGFEEYYKISNYSRIKRKPRSWRSGRKGGAYKTLGWGMVKQRRLKGGYVKATLCKDWDKRSYSVHVLEAKTFVPNPNNLPVVNHKDLNKDNNSAENLEWTTYSENTKHWIENTGYDFKGHKFAKKLTQEQEIQIKEFKQKNMSMTTRQIANALGFTYNQVRRVLKIYNLL